jgi:hypothetical protein
VSFALLTGKNIEDCQLFVTEYWILCDVDTKRGPVNRTTGTVVGFVFSTAPCAHPIPENSMLSVLPYSNRNCQCFLLKATKVYHIGSVL